MNLTLNDTASCYQVYDPFTQQYLEIDLFKVSKAESELSELLIFFEVEMRPLEYKEVIVVK